MSLGKDNFLKTPPDYSLAFQQMEIDTSKLFAKIIGLETIKKLFINAIYAHDPVHLILVGPPGNGKTLFLKAVLEAYPAFSLFIDSTISSGIGMIEGIFDMAYRLRFLLVDEIEKFSKRDRKVLLNVLETGILSRSLRNNRRILTNLRIWFFATCNNIGQMQDEQPELLNRCEILKIPALDYNMFEYVVSIRLQQEKGINNKDIAKYIANRVYNEFGHETNIRRCIRLARLANSHAVRSREDDLITRDIVDDAVKWLKTNIHTLDDKV
jgi:MoxR-like ATPase